MSVKRYELDYDGMTEDSAGAVVFYSDYAALEAKYAALLEAARPVVDDWTENRGTALDTSTDEEVGFVIATFVQLDTLAALVGSSDGS